MGINKTVCSVELTVGFGCVISLQQLHKQWSDSIDSPDILITSINWSNVVYQPGLQFYNKAELFMIIMHWLKVHKRVRLFDQVGD